MLKLLQYCNYIIIVMQTKLMLLLLLLTEIPKRNWKQCLCIFFWGGEGGEGENKVQYGLCENGE